MGPAMRTRENIDGSSRIRSGTAARWLPRRQRSLRPNIRAANHCHDFDARLLVLGGEITITRDNNPETFRAGQCCEVLAGCMHAEHVGPEGVAYVSGRRRNGGPLTREAFESDLGREGFEVVHGGQTAGFAA